MVRAKGGRTQRVCDFFGRIGDRRRTGLARNEVGIRAGRACAWMEVGQPERELGRAQCGCAGTIRDERRWEAPGEVLAAKGPSAVALGSLGPVHGSLALEHCGRMAFGSGKRLARGRDECAAWLLSAALVGIQLRAIMDRLRGRRRTIPCALLGLSVFSATLRRTCSAENQH